MTAVAVAALVPSIAIEVLIATRDAMVQRLTQACALLDEAVELSAKTFGDNRLGDLDLFVADYSGRRTHQPSVEELTKSIDARAWQHLLNESGLHSFMDAEARATWRKNIEHHDVPPLTLANITNTFAAMYASRGDMFERGVIAVFKSLSWSYKTNLPQMFGKRLVLRGIVDGWRYKGDVSLSVGFDGSNRLDDLIRVLSLLDGKPEPDHRQGTYRRLTDAKWPAPVSSFDLGYVTVRGFKNGNAHLTFNRPDLVDKMNLILAKHYPSALPASRED